MALLVRDLAQAVSPAGTSAPLRGAALREVDVVEEAFVLCRDGRIEAVGPMAELPALGGEVEELDGRGLCALPGLVDCHTHACFAGDRVEEFDLRSGGASYEELHAAGGGILSTVRATRAAGPDALAEITARHRERMRAHGTTTWEGKSGYGLDRETELAQLRAVRGAGGIPTWLGAHAVPPELDDADAYLDFALAEVLPAAAELAEAADVFLEQGTFDAAQARRYLEACRDAGLALRLHADQFTEAGGIPLAVELGARSVDHLEATGDEGVAHACRERRDGRAPAGRCARARAADAAWAGASRCRRGRRARDRLQSRERVLREPAARLLARVHAARALAGGGPRRRDRERGPRPRARGVRRAARPGLRRRSRPARRARLALPRLPRGRCRRRSGRRARRGRLEAIIEPCRAGSSGGAAQKLQRHEYEYVVETEDGEEIPLEEYEADGETVEGPRRGAKPKGEPTVVDRRGRQVQPPSFERVMRRAAIFGPILFAVVYLTSRDRLSVVGVVLNTLILLAFFIPFSYLVDRMVYRTVLRRSEKNRAAKRGR